MILSVLSVAAACALTWAGYRLLTEEFPDTAVLKAQYPQIVYRGKDKPFEVRWSKTRPASWASLKEISREAVGAVVVSEDWAFYQHKGYDVHQIKEAIEPVIERGRGIGSIRGASTITQQVVKNVFLTPERSLWRKLKELMLAIRLEETASKSRILETYFNIAEWGEGVFGITEAARHYFGKSPSELSAREGAFLAMLLPSPIRYAQSYRQKQLTEYARQTIDSILAKMEKAHYLSPEERAIARGSRFAFEHQPPEGGDEAGWSEGTDEIRDVLPELPPDLPTGLETPEQPEKSTSGLTQ